MASAGKEQAAAGGRLDSMSAAPGERIAATRPARCLDGARRRYGRTGAPRGRGGTRRRRRPSRAVQHLDPAAW